MTHIILWDTARFGAITYVNFVKLLYFSSFFAMIEMYFYKEDILNMKKILLGLGIMLFVVTGCGKTAKLENGQDAVVSLTQGSAISIDELYTEMKDRYAISVLVDMIDTKILNDKYPTDEDETKNVESQISSWLTTFGSEQLLLQQTQSAFGVSTMEELRTYLALQYKRGKAVEEYVKETVTDSEIQKYYDSEVFGDIRARHILISSEATSSMTSAEKAEKEEEALQKTKDLITKLNNGEDFETLAKEFSSDEATASAGGDLGYFAQGKMVTEFEDAVKALEVGKYTLEPVKTSYGYHIILKLDQKEKASLDTLKDTIIETLASKKLQEDATLQVTALMKVRENAGMAIEDKTLKTQYELYMQNTKASLVED